MTVMSKPGETRKVRPLMAGDIVRLKSGGPLMTVAFLDRDYSRLECSWFWRATRYSQNFTWEELTRVENDQYAERVSERLADKIESLDEYDTFPVTRASGDSQDGNSGGPSG